MLEPEMTREDLGTWAGFLLDHSLGGIVPEDRVMIKGERICWSLIGVLEQRGVLNRSAQHVDTVADFRPGDAAAR